MRYLLVVLLAAIAGCNGNTTPALIESFTLGTSELDVMLDSETDVAAPADAGRSETEHTVTTRSPGGDLVVQFDFDPPLEPEVIVTHRAAATVEAGMFRFPLRGFRWSDGTTTTGDLAIRVDVGAGTVEYSETARGVGSAAVVDLQSSIEVASAALDANGVFRLQAAGTSTVAVHAPQVTIEVRFVSTKDDFFEQIGVDFDFNVSDPVQAPDGLGDVAIPTNNGGTISTELSGLELTDTSLSDIEVQLIVALAFRGDAAAVSTPALVTMDTKVAEIRGAVGEVPFTDVMSGIEGGGSASVWQVEWLQQSDPRPVTAAALGGAAGWVLVDTVTGAELNTTFRTTGLDPKGVTFGVLPMVAGTPEIHGFLAFGAWGASIARFDFALDDFETPVDLLAGANVTDATPCGDGAVLVDNTNNEIRFAEFDATGETWVLSATKITSVQFAAAAGNVVSACKTDDGGLLFVTDGEPGELWFKADAKAAGNATKVGDVGDLPRRVRCLKGVGAVSAFGTGFGFGFVAVIDKSTGSWRIGPGLIQRSVGIDIKELANGDFAVATTLFSNDQYRIIEIDTAGDIVNFTDFALPAGCTSPGHAFWLHDESCRVLITCNGSDDAHAIPVNLAR